LESRSQLLKAKELNISINSVFRIGSNLNFR
jgi:hypothetical protein